MLSNLHLRRLQRGSGSRVQKREEEWQGFSKGIRLRNSVLIDVSVRVASCEFESDLLVGLFSFLFSPSQLYTRSFIFLSRSDHVSSRSIRSAALAQCTFTIGSRPILSGASRSYQPGAVFCGRRQTSADREAYHSVLNRVI
jgi:hypothetical protein